MRTKCSYKITVRMRGGAFAAPRDKLHKQMVHVVLLFVETWLVMVLSMSVGLGFAVPMGNSAERQDVVKGKIVPAEKLFFGAKRLAPVGLNSPLESHQGWGGATGGE